MLEKLLVVAVVVVGIAACSATPEEVGSSNAPVDYICSESAAATLDGIPAYPYCGDFNVFSNNGLDTRSSSGGAGWVQTEGGYGYQCVEYAVRYAHFKFGVSVSWGIGYAYEMCATHPSGISTTGSPVHGDLVVFTPGACGVDATAGHVAVVNTQTSSTVTVVQENYAGSYTYDKSCVKCYLHEAANGGSSDPCSGAPLDGLYCGQSTQFGKGGTPNDLYDCKGGVTASKTSCPYGCTVEPPGTNDQCAPAPADAGSDAAIHGDAAPAAEAGAAHDAAAPPPPAASDGGTTSGAAGGCAITVAPTPSRSGGGWLLALGLVFLRRRRSS